MENSWPFPAALLPNEVKLLRYFDEGSYMYLVFELCQGKVGLRQTGRKRLMRQHETVYA